MPSVFISYAREQKDEVQRLASDLTANGFIVWWDHLIHAGEEFDRYIRGRIKEADAVIVVWSDDAAASPYVQGEARMAMRLKKLVPVKVARFDMESAPLDFHAIHIAELDDRSSILSSVAAKVPRQAAPKQPAPLEQPAPTAAFGGEADLNTSKDISAPKQPAQLEQPAPTSVFADEAAVKTSKDAVRVSPYQQGLRRLCVFGGLVLLYLLAAMIVPHFTVYINLLNILWWATIIGVAAFGGALVIRSGGIDFSQGSIMMVAAALGAVSPQGIGFLVCVASGAFCGLLNGIVVWKSRISPLIVTLVTGFSYLLVPNAVTSGLQISLKDDPAFSFIGGQTVTFAIVILSGAASLVLAVTLGQNGDSSIKRDYRVVVLYSLSGLLSGVSGLLFISRLGSFIPSSSAMTYQIDILAAAIVGAYWFGGKFTVLGAAVGAMLVYSLKNMLILSGMSAYYMQATSAIMLAAVFSIAWVIGDPGLRARLDFRR